MSSKSQTILLPQVRLSLFRRVGIAQLVERLHAWSRTVRQQRHNICQIRAPPIPARTYGEENGSAAMLAVKRSESVIPEVNLRECVTHICICLHHGIRLPTLALKPRGDITRSPKRVSVSPQKGLMSSKLFFKKRLSLFLEMR